MRIPFDKLDDAVRFSDDEVAYWIDKKRAEVLPITPETKFLLEIGNTFEDPSEIEAIRSILIMLGEIESDEVIDESRFIEVESPSSDESWQMRADFTESLGENEVKNRLVRALRGPRPFRRFRDVLAEDDACRDKWTAFEREKLREFVEEWADGEGIEIDYGPDAP